MVMTRMSAQGSAETAKGGGFVDAPAIRIASFEKQAVGAN
jgi:hypothetical protein